ncbi:MAG: DUF4416 family protein [bacterium]
MKPTEPEPVKLFIGLLYAAPTLLEKVFQQLSERFGRIDYKSPEFEFSVSDYYKDEMGWPIFRKFVSFEHLLDPGELARIKIETNEIEEQFSVNGKRKVNLDPGYMDYNKVILASAKVNSQKIYLNDGIYADPTLWFERGEFTPYPFSFPDFKSNMYDRVFLHIRALFKGQRRKIEGRG